MAFTTLIADAFQGSGTLSGLATNGVTGAAWTQSAENRWTGGGTYAGTSVYSRSSGGLINSATSPDFGTPVEYVVRGDWTGPVQTGGMIWEVAFYGEVGYIRFRPDRTTGESFPYGWWYVALQTSGDVIVDTWGGHIGGYIPSPVANIGAITSTTRTIIQIFQSTGTKVFSVAVNGTTVCTLSGTAALYGPSVMSTTGSLAAYIEVAFLNTSFLWYAGDIGGPFVTNSPLLSYIHVATGTLPGGVTYLGSPPQLIYAASASVATASATLTSPPKPPDASVSYPFQNFVAWNELTAHTVSLQSARPLKLSLTALGVQTAAALSGDGSKLAVYILGNGDRWLSGGLMDHTPDGWVHLLTLPDRLYASGMPLSTALDGAGRRMVCANSTGWTAFTRNAPGGYFDEQGLISAPAVALGLDARGMTAAVLTSTAVLVYTSATATAPFVLRTSIPLPGTDTWAAMSISGDGMQLIVSGAAHSAVYTRTGEDWNQAATADMLLLLAAINTDGTLATAVEGSLLRTRGLQNARNLTTPLTPEAGTVSGFALTSAVMGLSEASGVFRLITALSRTLPASYGLADGMALLRELPVVRTYESTGDPRFRMAAQPAQNSAPHSGFWQGPSDETA